MGKKRSCKLQNDFTFIRDTIKSPPEKCQLHILLILGLSLAKISPLQRLDLKHCKSKAVFSINGQPRGMP